MYNIIIIIYQTGYPKGYGKKDNNNMFISASICCNMDIQLNFTNPFDSKLFISVKNDKMEVLYPIVLM